MLALLVAIFSHCSHGYYYGPLSTQMVTFKLIKHKVRHELCPENLPHLNQSQQLTPGHRKPCPPLFYVPSKEGAIWGSPFSTDKMVFFIYKGATQSKQTGHRMSLLLHTHSSKPAFLSGVGSRQNPGSPCLLSHRPLIPSGLLHKHVPHKSHEPLPLSPNPHCSVSKDKRKRKGCEEKKRTTMVLSHLRFSLCWALNIYDLG